MATSASEFAAFQDIDTEGRFPPLAWRWPTPLWLLVAFALSAGWPIVALNAQLGLGLAVGLGAATTALFSLLTVACLELAGLRLRARRAVVGLFVAYGTVFSLITPWVVGFFSGAVGTAGYTGAMAAALWPMGVMIGVPVALFAGLIFATVVFHKPEPQEPDVLVARHVEDGALVLSSADRDVAPFT